ncbi:MAG: histidinol-phosphate transaminase [bacterium]
MTAFTELANPWIRGLKVYEPGRPIEEVAREIGFADASDIIKLASNENSLGPSPRAVRAIKAAARQMHLYPDGNAFYLRQALGGKLQLPPECLVCGCGSNEIIELLGHVFLGNGTSAVMADRAFIVYKLIAAMFCAHAIAVPMRDLTHDLDAMLAAIRPDTRLVFVANPNNPTGTMVSTPALERFIEQVPEHVAVVVDEAYTELLPPDRQPDLLRYVRAGRKLILVRTFSKAYGLAGLRCGYAIAPPECIQLINRVRQPFNLTAMALAACTAALDDARHLRRTQKMVTGGLRQLEAGLTRLGVAFVPSVVNFMLVKTGAGRVVSGQLEREGVIVRPVDGYDLPDYLRVSVGTRPENARFLTALEKILAGRRG